MKTTVLVLLLSVSFFPLTLHAQSGRKTTQPNPTRAFTAAIHYSEFAQAFSWIAEELGRQYSLGYYPSTTGKDGERRQLKVKVTEPDLVVKARDSYIYSNPKNQKFIANFQLPISNFLIRQSPIGNRQ